MKLASARLGLCAAVGLFASTAAAQILSINSAVLHPRVFNDIPDSTVDVHATYHPGLWPSMISLGDSGVSAPSGFANRHTWQFSNTGGSSAFQLGSSDYFSASFDLTLTGSPITPRKEAGWLFSTTGVGDIQFIVNTDGHEVVQFGGISFYSFGNTYNSGDTIRLGLSYFQDANGRNALQFSANGIDSPVFEFAAGQGIGAGSTLGGYFQIVNDPLNANNSGTAVFRNLSIVPVPEPSVFALLGLGALAFLRRRN